jgi:hypothetical protein
MRYLLLLIPFIVACGSSPVSPTTTHGASPSGLLHTTGEVSCPDSASPVLTADTNQGRATLHWTVVPGITSYPLEIERRALGDSHELVRRDVTTGEGMQDGQLLYGTSLPAGIYRARIRTLNACGVAGPWSPYSEDFSFGGGSDDSGPEASPETPGPVTPPVGPWHIWVSHFGNKTQRAHACNSVGGIYDPWYLDIENPVCLVTSTVAPPGAWAYLGTE